MSFPNLRRTKPPGDANDLTPDQADNLVAIEFNQPGHGVVRGQPVASVAGSWVAANGNVLPTLCRGICVDESGDDISIMVQANFFQFASPHLLTIDSQLYLGQAAEGFVDQKPPFGIIQPLGWVFDATWIFFEKGIAYEFQ